MCETLHAILLMSALYVLDSGTENSQDTILALKEFTI